MKSRELGVDDRFVTIISERMESTLPEEVWGDPDAIKWLSLQVASMIDINEFKGQGLKDAFGIHITRFMVNFLEDLEAAKVPELCDLGRVEQIAFALRDLLDADFSTNLRPVGYDEHKDLLPYLVRIVLAGKLK